MQKDVVQVWKSCSEQIATRVSDQHFQTWICPIQALRLSEHDGYCKLTLGTPTLFHARWLRENFDDLLAETTADQLDRPVHIGFEVAAPDGPGREGPAASGEEEEERSQPGSGRQLELLGPDAASRRGPRSEPGDGAEPGRTIRPSRRRTASRTGASGRGGERVGASTSRERPASSARSGVSEAEPPGQQIDRYAGARTNDRYTFENFIQGDCNQLASNAALSIAKTPAATSYSPFFVYGGVGLGKTHLVQAVGNYLLASEADPRVHYVSSDSFTSQFVGAIQNNQTSEFKAFYRQVDVLIVDDIQFFSGKEKTQEEFFHIFNDLYQRGKQIILCADRSPAEIKNLEDRLLSRFRVGLSADMQPPDYETRAAILQHKAEVQGLTLDAEVVAFLARSITNNIRDLEGAVNKLHMLSETMEVTIDLPVARETLTDLLDGATARVKIEDIQKRVAAHFDLTIEELISPSRKQEISTARQIAMFFCRSLTGRTLKSIGMRFGGRDHSTVSHACKRVVDLRETDPAYEQTLGDVRRKLHMPV